MIAVDIIFLFDGFSFRNIPEKIYMNTGTMVNKRVVNITP